MLNICLMSRGEGGREREREREKETEKQRDGGRVNLISFLCN